MNWMDETRWTEGETQSKTERECECEWLDKIIAKNNFNVITKCCRLNTAAQTELTNSIP